MKLTEKQIYFDKDNNQVCQKYFVDNKNRIQGKFKSYGKDGAIIFEAMHLNGQLHVYWKTFGENGNVEYISQYRYGVPFGELIVLYGNGISQG